MSNRLKHLNKSCIK